MIAREIFSVRVRYVLDHFISLQVSLDFAHDKNILKMKLYSCVFTVILLKIGVKLINKNTRNLFILCRLIFFPNEIFVLFFSIIIGSWQWILIFKRCQKVCAKHHIEGLCCDKELTEVVIDFSGKSQASFLKLTLLIIYRWPGTNHFIIVHLAVCVWQAFHRKRRMIN